MLMLYSGPNQFLNAGSGQDPQPGLISLPRGFSNSFTLNYIFQPYERFQFERNGFFCVDGCSTPQRKVFNLTVGLKEDAGK